MVSWPSGWPWAAGSPLDKPSTAKDTRAIDAVSLPISSFPSCSVWGACHGDGAPPAGQGQGTAQGARCRVRWARERVNLQGRSHVMSAARPVRPWVPLLCAVLLLIGVSTAVAAPEGTLTFAMHFSPVTRWLDPAEGESTITPYLLLYALHDGQRSR